jgi:hypothetical protein
LEDRMGFTIFGWIVTFGNSKGVSSGSLSTLQKYINK